MNKKCFLITGILLSNIFTIQAFAENPQLNAVGAAGGAGAGVLAGRAFLSPSYSSVYTIEQVVTLSRTPSTGVVEIELNPTAQNLRNYLIQQQQNEIAGLHNRKAGAAGDEIAVRSRIAAIEARIGQLRNTADLDIVARDPNVKPLATYHYADSSELRQILKESQKVNGDMLRVRFSPRGVSALSMGTLAGFAGGIAGYVAVVAINPASAAETPSDGSIPFANTETAD